jgi:hypothetical protein
LLKSIFFKRTKTPLIAIRKKTPPKQNNLVLLAINIIVHKLVPPPSVALVARMAFKISIDVPVHSLPQFLHGDITTTAGSRSSAKFMRDAARKVFKILLKWGWCVEGFCQLRK